MENLVKYEDVKEDVKKIVGLKVAELLESHDIELYEDWKYLSTNSSIMADEFLMDECMVSIWMNCGCPEDLLPELEKKIIEMDDPEVGYYKVMFIRRMVIVYFYV